MIRFYIGNAPVALPRSQDDVNQAVKDAGTNFTDIEDRDGTHVLGAIGYTPARVSQKRLSAKAVIERAQKLIRQINLGRGKEFGRSPEEPLDDGMDEFEVKAFALSLIELATAAQKEEKGISLIVFGPGTPIS